MVAGTVCELWRNDEFLFTKWSLNRDCSFFHLVPLLLYQLSYPECHQMLRVSISSDAAPFKVRCNMKVHYKDCFRLGREKFSKP